MDRDRSGLGVTREVDFDALGQEPLATALPAPGEDGTPVLGLHAGAKPKLLFARALGWLIGAFHNLGGVNSVEKSGKGSRAGLGVKTDDGEIVGEAG